MLGQDRCTESTDIPLFEPEMPPRQFKKWKYNHSRFGPGKSENSKAPISWALKIEMCSMPGTERERERERGRTEQWQHGGAQT